MKHILRNYVSKLTLPHYYFEDLSTRPSGYLLPFPLLLKMSSLHMPDYINKDIDVGMNRVKYFDSWREFYSPDLKKGDLREGSVQALASSKLLYVLSLDKEKKLMLSQCPWCDKIPCQSSLTWHLLNVLRPAPRILIQKGCVEFGIWEL